MSYGQHNLAQRFREGYDSGKGSNVEIVKLTGGYTALVGYGHAVYAVRSPNGKIVTYGGWYFQNCRRYSGSMSTKSQYGTMSLLWDYDTLMLPPKKCANTDSEKPLYNRGNVVVKESKHQSAPKLQGFDVSALD